MVDFDNGRHALAKFFRGAIFVSLFIVAVPILTWSQPHREIVDINVYPWSSIGKLGARGQHCTAAVIGPNQILTAAHCLYMISTQRPFIPSERRFIPAAQIHFLLGYVKGKYRVHRIASRYTIPPTYVPPKIKNQPVKIKAGSADWAVLYTAKPFAPDVRPLRLATATPSVGTKVKMGGYPIERLHMMTADLHCQIKAVSDDGKLIVHDCVQHRGDSGSPLLSADDEGLILGVNVLVHSRRIVLEDQSKFKEGGIAVSAAGIAKFLASQAKRN